ncbi:TPA: hypothetical protein DDW35_07275 [Candidatus Sumerlaeota bacterium]|nr:hypothetical protein [Candidatus Sumerlaeota bacterium]
MVDAYATTLGKFTLALNDERFILEDPASNSVLTLHPALRFPNTSKPQYLTRINGFLTAEDRMEVIWQKSGDLEAITTLRLLEGGRLRLEFRVTNQGDTPIALTSAYPLYIPAEGPGTCALGMHELRTLGYLRNPAAPRLRRVHGSDILSQDYGAWFTESGRPCFLLGALDAGFTPTLFTTEGGRGKILELSVECPRETQPLAPGETWNAPAFLLALGQHDITTELKNWLSATSVADAVQLPDPLNVGAEIDDNEPEPEPAPTAEEIAAAEALAAAEEARKVEEEARKVETRLALEQPETEAIAMEESAEETDDDMVIDWHPQHLSRCATFQRALRASEGVWPRWGMGRRYFPATGDVARSRLLNRRVLEAKKLQA